MRGLCPSCLSSDQELIKHKGTLLCMDCLVPLARELYHGKFKPSEENKPEPTFEDLKKKLERT